MIEPPLLNKYKKGSCFFAANRKNTGMFECDLSPYSQAIEDTRLQFSAEGTATFMLDDDYIAHKELSSVGAIENDHNVTLRLEWENGEVVYECPVAVKYEPPIVRS